MKDKDIVWPSFIRPSGPPASVVAETVSGDSLMSICYLHDGIHHDIMDNDVCSTSLRNRKPFIIVDFGRLLLCFKLLATSPGPRYSEKTWRCQVRIKPLSRLVVGLVGW